VSAASPDPTGSGPVEKELPAGDETNEPASTESGRFLVGRTGTGLWIALGIAVLFALVDVWAYPRQLPGVWLLKLCYLGLLLGSLPFSYRRRLLMRQQEVERQQTTSPVAAEAQISASLARVGQTLIEHLNRPTLLEQLCRTTVEELGCDFSHTWLSDTKEDAILPVAGFGDPAEIWEALRQHRIPGQAAVQGDLAALLASGSPGQFVVDGNTGTGQLPEGWRPLIYGLTVLCCVALRQGGKIIGAHIAGYRGQHRPFTQNQQRILNGIGHLASMAFEHTLTVQQLERANRVKSDFVANMSHDMYTPINVIRGYADLAMDGEFGDVSPELRETLRRMDERAEALQDLVRNTLDLAQLETGEFPTSIEEVTLNDLIAGLDAEPRSDRDGSPVTFTWQVEGNIERIRTDVTKLKRVLRNLICNAFKFTPSGSVSVEVRRRAGGMEFVVRDTGIGIPPDLRETIFNPFQQGDESSKTRHKGTGLGLHICRRVLETMGGRIDLDSEVGQGSVFRVWLPAEVVSSGSHEES
jgi:signal transduction histidine kinase